MATTSHKVSGTAYWAKVFDHNKDTNVDFHGEGGAYTIQVVLDKENLDSFSASGSRLKPKLGEDGISIQFKRKAIHPSIPELGGAPQVVDADGNEWDPSVAIGNGSEVTVAFDVYDTKMGKGTRLTGIKVDNLVEFESEGGGAPKLPFSS